MELLRDHGLIFGNLMDVDEPHMVDRYNGALAGFGIAPTRLEKFQIDLMGFSPQVANDIKDPDYLDPAGVNRRFIILSPNQINLPVVHSQFSNTEDLMVEFFKKNSRVLYALTIKDVVFGEIEDSVFVVEDIEDLLAIEQVEFKISTATGVLGKAGELRVMMDRLLKEPDAWQNDQLLESMVDAVDITGDVRVNSLVPKEVIFRHETFWTAHFGGLYVFNDEDVTTVIGQPDAKGFRRSRPWQVSYLDINDREAVFDFLNRTRRIEVPRGSWVERTGLLDIRARMAAIWMARELEPELDFSRTDRRWVKSWVAANSDIVDDEGSIPLIKWVLAKTSNWSDVDMEEIHPDRRFVLCRANPENKDNFLVNRLISQYLPFDYTGRYIYNKPGFYEEYKFWPKTYQRFVVEELSANYMRDRAGYREKLYH